MAPVNELAVNKTKYDANASGSNTIPAGEGNSSVHCSYDYYTTAVDIEATSTISLCNLPKGAKIRGVEVTHSALGTGVTLALGDALDADRYFGATASATAGTIRDMLQTGVNYQIGTTATDDVPILTVGTASANGTIEVVFFYSF